MPVWKNQIIYVSPKHFENHPFDLFKTIKTWRRRSFCPSHQEGTEDALGDLGLSAFANMMDLGRHHGEGSPDSSGLCPSPTVGWGCMDQQLSDQIQYIL